MHRNRLDYDLYQYQAKLRRSYQRLGLVLKNKESKTFSIFHPIPCCPWLEESRKKYYNKIKSRAKCIKPGKKYTFATLTYSTRFYTPEQAAARCKKDFNLFLKRLQYYQNRKKLEYFYVVELTDALMVHFHVIFDQYIPWKKLRNSWWSVTGNCATNIKALPPQRAFAYALKYVTQATKMNQDKFAFLFKNIDRLYAFSKGFCGPAPLLEKAWEYCFMIFGRDGVLESSELTEDDILPIAALPGHAGWKVINPSDSFTYLPEGYFSLMPVYDAGDCVLYFDFYLGSSYWLNS